MGEKMHESQEIYFKTTGINTYHKSVIVKSLILPQTNDQNGSVQNTVHTGCGFKILYTFSISEKKTIMKWC